MSELSKVYDRSRVPLYIQVASVMRRRIETKQWLPGQKISTLVELEREFEVARVTIRQAIDILREEGLSTLAARPRNVRRRDAGFPLLVQARDKLGRAGRDDQRQRPQAHQGARSARHCRRCARMKASLLPKYVFMRSVQFKDGEPYGIVNLHLADDVFPARTGRLPAASRPVGACRLERHRSSRRAPDGGHRQRGPGNGRTVSTSGSGHRSRNAAVW